MGATRTLAGFVADTRYTDLPATRIGECKIATLDNQSDMANIAKR